MTHEGDRATAGDREGSAAGSGWTTVAAPRSDAGPEWELFLRESPSEPLRHAGSVTAPDAETAHERATGLFPDATTLWCCPAAETYRFAQRDLGRDYREADGTADEAAGEVADEAADGTAATGGAEP